MADKFWLDAVEDRIFSVLLGVVVASYTVRGNIIVKCLAPYATTGPVNGASDTKGVVRGC